MPALVAATARSTAYSGASWFARNRCGFYALLDDADGRSVVLCKPPGDDGELSDEAKLGLGLGLGLGIPVLLVLACIAYACFTERGQDRLQRAVTNRFLQPVATRTSGAPPPKPMMARFFDGDYADDVLAFIQGLDLDDKDRAALMHKLRTFQGDTGVAQVQALLASRV